jgi:excisionase family DNA binding protein
MMTNTPAESAETASAGRAAGPVTRPEARPATHAERDGLWDVRDVAAYLKLPTSSIYKMTAKAAVVRIPHMHIGGALRFRRTDVDRWLAALTTSNIDRLEHVRKRAQEVTHGNHP